MKKNGKVKLSIARCFTLCDLVQHLEEEDGTSDVGTPRSITCIDHTTSPSLLVSSVFS